MKNILRKKGIETLKRIAAAESKKKKWKKRKLSENFFNQMSG